MLTVSLRRNKTRTTQPRASESANQCVEPRRRAATAASIPYASPGVATELSKSPFRSDPFAGALTSDLTSRMFADAQIDLTSLSPPLSPRLSPSLFAITASTPMIHGQDGKQTSGQAISAHDFDLFNSTFPSCTLDDLGLTLLDSHGSSTLHEPSISQAWSVNMTTSSTEPHDQCLCVQPCCDFSIPWISPCCKESLQGPHYGELIDCQALSLPPEGVVQSLIRLYFVYVHPTFPVISERNTYCLMHPMAISVFEEQVEPMSLALLNAILFSASAVRLVLSVDRHKKEADTA